MTRYLASKPHTYTRNLPPICRNTPMLSRPPSTMTTPASQRTREPKRFSNSSGMVITPESRSGFTQKPVQPTTSMARK